jgi:hypothetical protein
VTYKVEQSVDLAAWTATPTIPIVFNNPMLTATATHVGGLSGLQRFYRIVTTLDVESPTVLKRSLRKARR